MTPHLAPAVLDRRVPPTEDEQVATYLAIADALKGRRLTVRTLDAGGDKPLPDVPSTTEANPFLGRRGIRLSLEQIPLFKPPISPTRCIPPCSA